MLLVCALFMAGFTLPDVQARAAYNKVDYVKAVVKQINGQKTAKGKRIPFKISPKCMKNKDKAGGKVFGFIHF